MAFKIDNNHTGLNGLFKSDKSKGTLATNLEKMASGKRINKAADDAARLAIATRFISQIEGSQQAYRNLNDGISLAQTGEGALNELSSSVQRIRELALQSANATLNDSDRQSLQQEVDMLQSEINRVTGSTEFNGISLLNSASSMDFQVGANAGDTVAINTQDVAGQLNSNGLNSIDISTAAGASSALSSADSALSTLSQSRAEYGATINRFEAAGRNLQNQAVNLEAARSRLEDTDYAQESSNFAANQIRQQAQTAMQSQANASQGVVLQLLR